MGVLSKVLLSIGLLFANADTSEIEESDQTYTESEIVEDSTLSDTDTGIVEDEEVIENTEQQELIELLNKWLNGEIELDEATLQKVYDKLSTFTEAKINQALEKYIADSEERQKVSGIVMAILGAFLSFLAMTIYLKKIKNQGAVATLNNETFSESSKIIKKQVAESKTDINEIKQIIQEDKALREKSDALIKESMELTQKQIDGIIGVLKITYNVGEENDSKAKETSKE